MDHRRARRLLPLFATAGLLSAALAAWQVVGNAPAPAEGSRAVARPTAVGVPSERLGVPRAAGEQPEPIGARPAWRDDEVMVSAARGASLTQIAADLGTSLRRPPGRRGYAPMRVPPGVSPEALLERLRQDERVASADRAGFIYGASDSSERVTGGGSFVDLQWHLAAMNAPSYGTRDLSGVVVAVLDTGVAYETYTDGAVEYVAAPSLSGTAFVSPYDFVNGDAHPNDDHQHGTHITSLIASDGEVEGVAPGVQIMPLKVLDATNSGSEVDLIEAIDWAVLYGADILNMSLAFSEGYAPSGALREALQDASDAGVLMIAAAGNGGEKAALYPAASPLVMSVGATALDEEGALETASYSNLSPTVDVMAPGGDITVDMDGDGYVDGVLAETINPDLPSEIGYWLYAGTSQATALVTGAAAHLMAEGETDPERITRALQAGAVSAEAYPYYAGVGAGDLDADGALDALDAGGSALDADMEYHVSVLPYLRQVSTSRVQPYFALKALDSTGTAAKNVILVGSIWGSGGDSFFKCKTGTDGTCLVKGTSITHTSRSVVRSLAWGVSVDAAYSNTGRRADWQSTGRPTGMFYATDGLVLLTEALAAEDLLWDAPLAISWSAGTDEDLGRLFASYSVVNMASGAALRPEGLLFTTPAIDGIGSFTPVTLDLDALGLTAESLGTVDVSLFALDGEGLESDPLGIAPRRLLAISGEGLESDPLGVFMKPRSLYITGEGLESDPLGFSTQPVCLSLSLSSTLSLTSLGTLLGAGGWLDEDGYPGATALMSSGAVGMSWSEPALSAGAVGATELE